MTHSFHHRYSIIYTRLSSQGESRASSPFKVPKYSVVDLRAYSTQDTAFHRAIAVAAGNSALLIAWESLSVEARVLATTITTDVDLKDAAERHAPILAAVKAGDVQLVSALLRSIRTSTRCCPTSGDAH
jgi:DNA-binding FadR family transcriptional regulator